MNAIEVRNLTKRYGGKAALEKVTFALMEGVVYGILGPNGSGKSTLLRLLATLERPTSGSIAVLGRDVAVATRGVRKEIGFVPEGFAVSRGFTVEEHLDFFATCHGLSKRERQAAVDTMLQLVDLEGWRDRDVEDLSRGQRQRLALASAMAHNPPVLIMDEPLAGLDALGRTEMLEVMKELRTMGKVVILSSHNLAEISPLCDAIGLLHRGRLVASGPISEVFSQDAQTERQVQLEVSAGLEQARTLLLTMPEVHDLDVQGSGLTFNLGGDDTLLPAVLERLLTSGVRIRRLTLDTPEAESALVRTFQELAA
jgi:ABC-2 type transport system ATP-binding protein